MLNGRKTAVRTTTTIDGTFYATQLTRCENFDSYEKFDSTKNANHAISHYSAYTQNAVRGWANRANAVDFIIALCVALMVQIKTIVRIAISTVPTEFRCFPHIRPELHLRPYTAK